MSSLLQRAKNNADLPKAFVTSFVAGRKEREVFDSIERYCMFIGNPRSGHSLVGSLLDAHPEAVISHELDALRYVHAGFTRDQLYALILEKQRADAEAGRWSGVYQYAVPDQWQGRYSKLRVIGDKKGGRSTRRMLDNPRLLPKLRSLTGIPVRFVHIVRNPFDNITTMHGKKKDRSTLADTLAAYFRQCEGVEQTRRETADGEMLELRHEDLLVDTPAFLRTVCSFVGLEATDDYIASCASILFESPNRSREKGAWTPELIAEVERRMQAFSFLSSYSFES